MGQKRKTLRWVVTQKEDHDGMKTKVKVRLVVRGFQEDKEPRAYSQYSPMLAKESLKVMIAIAANEGFQIHALEIH